MVTYAEVSSVLEKVKDLLETAVTTTQPHFPGRKIMLRRKEKNVPYK
jgi:hypothetical protein